MILWRDKKRVLVVDEEPKAANAIKKLLETKNYEVYVASTGEDAIRIARQLHPDAITMELVMPDIDGYQVCMMLKEDDQTADIPVVVVSSRDTQQSRLCARSFGSEDFIPKPFDGQRLIQSLEALTDS